MFAKTLRILLNTIPVIVMIGLIPVIQSDALLTLIDIVIIAIALALHRERRDFRVLIFGFFIMLVIEYLFISMGVEKFHRDSLLGVMPLWLPFLWAYGFVVIKRSVLILIR